MHGNSAWKYTWSSESCLLTIVRYVFIACKHNLWGDHPWLGGTTYGAVDSPGGPTMATKFAVDGPGGPPVA